jgi:CubicO group peptidase (beta-lactamase class C family)
VASFLLSNKFNGTVLVAKNGKVVMSKGYGQANVATHETNQADTIFRVGSITKSLTAVAVMQLVEQGKLNLDDTVSKFIPDFKLGDKITIRQLLSHTSGIGDSLFVDKVLNDPAGYVTPEDLVKLNLNLKLDSEPGTKFSYSNVGYHMLGYIIERVSHTSWENYVNEHFFKPLNMTRSGVDINQPVLSKHAVGTDSEDNLAPFMDMSYAYSAGAVYSTVGDMLKFDQALTSGKLINLRSYETMTAPVANNLYGFGWADGKKMNHSSDWKWHNGEISGYLGFNAVNAKENMEVILLSNKEKDAKEYSYTIASGVVDIVEKNQKSNQ